MSTSSDKESHAEAGAGGDATTATTSAESSTTFSERWTKTINSFHEPFLKHVLHPTTQLGKYGAVHHMVQCNAVHTHT